MGPRPQYYFLHLIKIPFNSVQERLTLPTIHLKIFIEQRMQWCSSRHRRCLGVQNRPKSKQINKTKKSHDAGPYSSLQVDITL